MERAILDEYERDTGTRAACWHRRRRGGGGADTGSRRARRWRYKARSWRPLPAQARETDRRSRVSFGAPGLWQGGPCSRTTTRSSREARTPSSPNAIWPGAQAPALARAQVGRFSDGEIQVEIGENVRGQDTFIVQSTCPPANDQPDGAAHHGDALKRARGVHHRGHPLLRLRAAGSQGAPRTPITAKLVADLIEAAGATRVVSMDMHAGQIQGFFNIPFDHLYARPVFLEDMRRRFDGRQNVVVVSPDAGGVERARAYSKRLSSTLAIVDKRRPRPNVSEVMNLIGDVRGKDAILIDDMIDTAGTLTQAANALEDKGAARGSSPTRCTRCSPGPRCSGSPTRSRRWW